MKQSTDENQCFLFAHLQNAEEMYAKQFCVSKKKNIDK